MSARRPTSRPRTSLIAPSGGCSGTFCGRGERGSALIVAISVLLVGSLLATVAVREAVGIRKAADRGTASKQALQAADAGVESALDAMNRLAVDDTLLPCVARASGGLLSLVGYDVALGSQWCPQVSEQLADGRSFRYRVSAAVQVTGSQVTLDRTIVSFGRSGSVERRVAAKVSALTGTPLFSNNAVISLQDLVMPSSARITGNARSNGNIALSNSAEICGDATPGPGHSVSTSNSAHVCSGFSSAAAAQDLVLAPIDQGSAATTNDNGRICGLDPCTSASKISWTPSTRRLVLSNNSSVTLGGSLYSFCQLELLNNSSLIIPVKSAGSSVRIYIDAPANCPGVSPVGGLVKANGAQIVNLNGDPVTLQIYVVGSATQDTSVSFTNNNVLSTGTPLVVYAPYSTVTLVNHARIKGAIAARRIVMGNNVAIDYSESIGSLATEAILPLYRRQQYRECPSAPPAGGAPDAGC